jgi:hypothetical protein
VATTTILRILTRKRALKDNCGVQCVAVTYVNATSFVSVISGAHDLVAEVPDHAATGDRPQVGQCA